MPLLATPAIPDLEQDRLAALRECNILDTEPDPEFDTLIAHAARLTQVPIALLSLVDESRQWFKSKIGLAANSTPRSISFCGYTIRQRTPLIVEDARLDPRFASNPLVTGEPRIVFYAGWPLITHEGLALGSLCVIDHVPRTLTVAQHEAIALLARQVVLSLELRRAPTQGIEIVSPLSEATKTSDRLQSLQKSQAQLAQHVVHDLKNPLTTIGTNTTYVLETANMNRDQLDALRDVLSAAKQMQSMLLDLLDIGRGTHAGGLTARKERIALRQFVRALIGSGIDHSKGSTIVLDIESDIVTVADPNLLSRMLSNLVDNARRYAPDGSTITVAAQRHLEGVLISIADLGVGIRDADKRRVFESYVQLDAAPQRTGRGLGLVFCKLAAEAHGGEIYVEDNRPRGTRFCVRLPDRL
ncbi:MAG: GAF domain-containing sensor histidine kinase [Kofleriaceae bacterium]